MNLITIKNILTEATPSQDGSIIKRCSICNDSQLVQTIAKPDVYTITKNTYNGKSSKPSVTITDRNGKKLSPSSYEIIYKKTGKKMLVPIRLRLISVVTILEARRFLYQIPSIKTAA